MRPIVTYGSYRIDTSHMCPIMTYVPVADPHFIHGMPPSTGIYVLKVEWYEECLE